MAASVLNSPKAIEMSIYVVRTFIRLRQMIATHTDLARKLDALERKYDSQFRLVFDPIRELMTPASGPKKQKIGFSATTKE